MRTTVDLPEDLHSMTLRIARDRGVTLSEAVADLMRRGLGGDQVADLGRSAVTGLPTLRVGRRVTEEDVRSLDDDI